MHRERILQGAEHLLLTLTNILLPTELWPAVVGVQYTDMDLRSRENSSVHSFLISCLMTCGDSTGLSQKGAGTPQPVLHALANNPAELAELQ